MIKFCKRFAIFVVAVFLGTVGLLGSAKPASAASFNPNYIMSDTAFSFTSSSWSASQIDHWLNAKYPSGCISGSFRTADPQGWSSSQNKYIFGGNVTAGQAIHDAAANYHLDPRVILTMLQKEQSIVTGGAGCHNTPTSKFSCDLDNDPSTPNVTCTTACPYGGGCMPIAMSMGCPGNCDARYNGFSMQLISAAWLLRFGQERAYGRTSGYDGYDPGDETYTYTGPLVSPAGDGSYRTQDGHNLHIVNGATASLYYYNPFYSGNSHFFDIYVNTFGFGNPTTPCYGTSNVSGKPSGHQLFINKYDAHGDTENLTAVQFNQTSSACIESYVMGSGYKRWALLTPTASQATDPAYKSIVAGNMGGDRRDELMYIKYRGTSGRIEVHTFSADYQKWASHIATNQTSITPSNGEVITGDMNGDGRDELMYIKYSGTGGRVEVHTWAPGLHSWALHKLTPLKNFDPTKGQIITGDLNGDGRDELLYIKYNGSGGHVEVHALAADYHTWVNHKLTSLSGMTRSIGQISAGDMDGKGRDQLLFIKYNGSSARVEVHTWGPDLHTWVGHTATAMGGFTYGS